MKGISIDERAIELAHYIIDSKDTVRGAAKKFGISKSTVHKDVSERLKKINPILAREVREILEYIMIHVVDGKFEIPMKTDIEVTYRWYGEGIEI